MACAVDAMLPLAFVPDALTIPRPAAVWPREFVGD